MFVAVKVSGQCAYLRTFDKCFTTFQPKYDGEKYDLRLNDLIPGLREIIDSYKPEKEDQTARKLVPFIAILVKIADDWKLKVVQN